jgi:hypothetical protein
VGSLIYAFGTATTPSSGNVTFDASAGHVQLGKTSASGLVTVVGSASLDLNLTSLGGRSIKAFDFVGTAQLVVDYGSGTSAPFTTYNSSEIDLTRSNASIGTRDLIQVGADSIDIVGMSSDPLIVPSTTVSTLIFSIAHRASGTVENFITYSAFITQLTGELNGSVLVTGVTALGQFTSSGYTFTSTSITVVLNN